MVLTNTPAGPTDHLPSATGADSAASRSHTSHALHELSVPCLRVLQCTARAMAHSPGGLRFKPGTRPWLEGLATSPTRVSAPSRAAC